jgi:uncharacterized protein (UPF0303 family)
MARNRILNDGSEAPGYPWGMTIEADLARIALQEERLQFSAFTLEDAWSLGQKLRAEAQARKAPVAIDISLAARQLFFAALEGSTPDNADWIRRKRNCALRFSRSSYHVKLGLDLQKTDLFTRFALKAKGYAASGGSFPLIVRGAGVVGAITVSGLPQREDHSLIVKVLAEVLGEDIKALALGDAS